MAHRILVAVAVPVALLALAACALPEPTGADDATPATSGTHRTTSASRETTAKTPAAKPGTGKPSTGKPGTVEAQLAALPVKGRAPMTGYDRDQFGPAWKDVDRNGCDTRNDVLRRDLDDVTLKARTHGCVVLTGMLRDPYTSSVIAFRRGVGTSSKVQIDHVVALGDAWQTGARKLSADRRERLANDPLELLAVDGPTNESKGDGDAATWLPPNKAFRCIYVRRQIAVKARYDLWVTKAEKAAMAGILSRCG